MDIATALSARTFPPFDLVRLLRTVFDPKKGEKVCLLIDLDTPEELRDFAFLQKEGHAVQKRAYEIFYQGLLKGGLHDLGLASCALFAYKKTGGSNLELPDMAIAIDGRKVSFEKEIYPAYDIFLCIGDYSATAPMTAMAKRFGFRGATMHGMNEAILKTGLAVDYNEVSHFTEGLRLAMTDADSSEIQFVLNGERHHLHIDLGRQAAQKSHGICHTSPDIVNLPAGEVYFVPLSAKGSFPMKFDDGTLGTLQVEGGKVTKVNLVKGSAETIQKARAKFESDPASAILGELGFGTQVLPYAGHDIQDEKIFGTFHLATGRNDHLKGSVTLDRFVNKLNATHDDILFSSVKTPEIQVAEVRLQRHGMSELLIENGKPAFYLWNQLLLAKST